MQKHILRAFIILSLIFSGFAQATPLTFNLEDIKTQNLSKENQAWFIEVFPKSFMSVYQDKTFVITKEKKPQVLGPKNKEDKNQWLLETAKEEFEDYVINPKRGYKAILIQYQNKPIGVLLYRLLENEKTIYLAQYFIVPEFQKKGIGQHVLNMLPKMYPEYKHIEILARHQNDAAFHLYTNAGFSLGDINLVNKYDYDPLRYMGFYKNIN